MVLHLTEDDAFEAFQLWWHALRFANHERPNTRRMTELSVKQKFEKISEDTPLGGRVLRRPCRLTLLLDERLAILECLIGTPWRAEMIPEIKKAARPLGAEVH